MSGSLLLICELLSKVEVVKVSQLPKHMFKDDRLDQV